MRLPVPVADGHLGDRLAKTADGMQPRLSKRRSDTPTPDLDTFPWLAEGRAAAAAKTAWVPSLSPSRASSRRSDAETLSRARLMGEGQAVLLLARKGSEEEAVGKSELPV